MRCHSTSSMMTETAPDDSCFYKIKSERLIGRSESNIYIYFEMLEDTTVDMEVDVSRWIVHKDAVVAVRASRIIIRSCPALVYQRLLEI